MTEKTSELTQQQVSKNRIRKLKYLALTWEINQWEVMDRLIDEAYSKLEAK